MDNINTKYIFNIIDIHRKKLILIAVCSIVISAFLSSPLFINPKYKSTAVVFPTNLEKYSEESNTEQLLQFMNSEEVKIAMTNRFNLYKVFDIDSNEARSHAKFDNYYNEYISVSATLYESVVINVIDESPMLSQKMANALIEESNLFIRAQKKVISDEYVKSYRNQLKILTFEIDSIESKLKDIRMNYGILDFKSQSKIITKRASKDNLSEDEKLLLKGLKEVGGQYVILQEQLKTELNNYKKMKFKFDKNVLNSNSELSFTTVVSKANLPDKKYSPQRVIIVLFFTISVLLMSIFIILFTHKKQNNLAKS